MSCGDVMIKRQNFIRKERNKMRNELTVKELYTLEETIAKDVFEGITYPWEALPKIGAFIKELGERLPEDEYEKKGEDVWIAKSAKVFPSAYIHGPAIMWEILSWVIRHIWGPAPLLLM